MAIHIRTLLVAVIMMVATNLAQSQILEIKDWDETYPDMEDSYPLSFISFKGWLIPVPHFFIRTYPTHYYIKVGSTLVIDAGEIAGGTKTGLLRIIAKALERHQMKGRYSETEQIKINSGYQQEISQKLFDAQGDQLSDIYKLAVRFVELYKKLDRLGKLDNSSQVKSLLEKEADQLLVQFLMVNLMQSDHGQKLDVFSQINSGLISLSGEVDYTYGKLHFFNADKLQPMSYSFLTQ